MELSRQGPRFGEHPGGISRHPTTVSGKGNDVPVSLEAEELALAILKAAGLVESEFDGTETIWLVRRCNNVRTSEPVTGFNLPWAEQLASCEDFGSTYLIDLPRVGRAAYGTGNVLLDGELLFPVLEVSGLDPGAEPPAVVKELLEVVWRHFCGLGAQEGGRLLVLRTSPVGDIRRPQVRRPMRQRLVPRPGPARPTRRIRARIRPGSPVRRRHTTR